MQKSQEEIDTELNEDMAAFNRDPDTWPFREYWQTNDERFVELTSYVDQVATGKIVVSGDIIGQCREAVLQINQIAHVMTELSKGIGQAHLVGAMNIAYTYDVRAGEARAKLLVIEGWRPQADHRPF